MKKSRSLLYLLLFCILVLGLVLRLKYWPDYLPFDFEKARDLIASRNIYLNKKPTLIGPTTEVEGIFHGPLYYYLIGFFYYLFDGDPRAGSIVSFSFNLASVGILFYLGKRLFNQKVGLIAAFLYAVSFEAVSYAYWISNPGPSVPFLFLMFFFFYLFLTEKSHYLILSLFCLGVSLQFQILNIIFVIPLVLAYFLFGRPKITLKNFLLSLISLFLPISTFILFELKHQFLMINAFLNRYLSSGQAFGFNFSFSDYFTRLAREFSHIIFPVSEKTGWLLLTAVLLFLTKKIFSEKKNKIWKYLLIWIFATFPIFFINSRIGQSSAAFIGISGAIILATAALLAEIFKKKHLLLGLTLLVIGLANLKAVDIHLTKPGLRLFDAYEELYLQKNFSIVEWVYQEAEEQTFQLDTVTSPLYVSPLWDYLFSWYSGKENLSAPSRDNPKIKFLILEPFVDAHFKTEAVKKIGNGLTLEKEKDFGGTVVQKWALPKKD